VVDIELEIGAALKRHVVRLSLDFSLPRAAPRVSNPDAPGFSDPGDPGHMAVMGGCLLRPALRRERRLCAGVISKMNDDEVFLRWLHVAVMEGMPYE